MLIISSIKTEGGVTPDTFSHEGGDGEVEHIGRHAGVVGHRILLHALEGRELHNLTDDLIGDRQVQEPHDALNFTPGILGE